MSDLKAISAVKGNIFAITHRLKRIMGKGEVPTDIIDLEQTIKLCAETADLLPSDGALRAMRSVTNYGHWDFTHIALSERIAVLEAELARKDGALQELLDATEEPPAPNCSCHISPPCRDCIDFAHIREAITTARAAIKPAKEG